MTSAEKPSNQPICSVEMTVTSMPDTAAGPIIGLPIEAKTFSETAQPQHRRAPIILDPKDRQAMDYAVSFVRSHKERGHMAAAEEEARRLKPWFEGYSKRLQAALDTMETSPSATISIYKQDGGASLRDLTTPGNLSKLFTACSDYTKNTVLSEFLIAPASLFGYDDNDIKRLLEGRIYNSDIPYGSQKFSMGFIQVFENKNGKNVSDTIVPIFTLDDDILKTISPHGGDELLLHLQNALTLINHDPLHNYSIEYISAVSGKFSEEQAGVRAWINNYFNRDSGYFSAYDENGPLGYEGWANLSQARTWEHLTGMEGERLLDENVEGFMDKLQEISFKLEEETDLSRYQRHKVIDYLGTSMIFALGRIYPLDHPKVKNAIKKLELIDPAPEQVVTSIEAANAHYAQPLDVYKYTTEQFSSFIDTMLMEANSGAATTVISDIPIGTDRAYTFSSIYRNLVDEALMYEDEDGEKTALQKIHNKYLQDVGPSEMPRHLDDMPADKFKAMLMEMIEICKDEGPEETRPNYRFSHSIAFDVKRFASIAKDKLKTGHTPFSEETESAYLAHIRTFAEENVQATGESVVRAVLDDRAKDKLNVTMYDFNEPGKDYESLKRLQVAKMSVNVAYINAPASEGSMLEEGKERVDRADLDMLGALAKDLSFQPQ